MTTAITGGEVFVDGKLVKKDLLIEDGRIAAIGENLRGETEIKADGLAVLPGVVDCHVHCRDLEEAHKEDFLSMSSAAAAGGVTTVLAMPNTRPPILTLASLEQYRKAAAKSIVNYGIYMAGAGNASVIMKASGICGVKIYLDATTGDLKIEDEADITALFSSHPRIAVHAEGLKVDACITRNASTSGRLYLCHISTKKEIETIRKRKTAQVFCEVTPHHLFLTHRDHHRLGALASMKPILKAQEDVDALWAGIADGTVDTIGTDHAPHTLEEKASTHPPWGVPGLQTSLPLMLDAVNQGRLTLARLVALMSTNPCKIFNIEKKGRIKKGYDADLVLVDLAGERVVTRSEQRSKCGWSPFEGKRLKGWPVMTIVGGHVVFDGEKVHTHIKAAEVEFS